MDSEKKINLASLKKDIQRNFSMTNRNFNTSNITLDVN